MHPIALLSSWRPTLVFWTVVLLGSCSVVQNTIVLTNDIPNLVPKEPVRPNCTALRVEDIATISPPKLPSVNLSSLSEHEIIDILIGHAEQTSKYVKDLEERLRISLQDHLDECFDVR